MSSTGTYTPGPWSIYETAGNGGNIPARMEVVAPESERAKRLIANVYGFKLPEGRANARLIAAAPELCEALENLIEFLVHGKKNCQAILRAKAALARARGDEGEDNA
jgi:hypothetical protein